MGYFLSFSLLRRNHNFRYLYFGQFISFLGSMITSVAIPFQIYRQTQSTLMVGLVSLFQLIPLLFTALLGGVLADRRHRKTLLIIAESILALGCLVLTFNAHHNNSIWIIFIVSAAMSGLTGLHRPAFSGITQQIVAEKDFLSMSSLSTFLFSACMIAGPAVGGLLISHIGLVATYFLDFLSFLISIAFLSLIKDVAPPVSEKQPSVLFSLKEGFQYAWKKQELLGTYFVDFAAMVFGMPMALFPAIAEHHGGAKTLGLLYSAPAVGGMLISLVSGWTEKVKRQGMAVALAAFFWGISIIFFGLSNHLWMALLFLIFAGAFDAISGIFRQAMWNDIIPNHYRGRLSGIEMISYMSGPKLGDTESGLVAAAFGITTSIVSGGVLCIVGVAICCYFLPNFWRYKKH